MDSVYEIQCNYILWKDFSLLPIWILWMDVILETMFTVFSRRFTRHLAAKAKHIDRVDFSEEFSNLNRKQLEDLSNISFRIADISSFSLDGEKYIAHALHRPILH